MPIATVIAAGRLDQSLVDRALALAGGGSVRWIDRGDAADLQVAGPSDAVRDALRPLEDEADVIVQPRERRVDVGLFVADMDSTMIGQECIDELADYAGFKPQVAAITERAMRGELDFRQALAERVALLDGLDRSVIDRCRKERIRANPGATMVVATLKAAGVRTLLVSGGFTGFVAPLAAELGFDDYLANVLGVDDGRLTGLTVGPVVDSMAKQRAAQDALHDLGLASDALLAVGDGANDSAMVAFAGIGVGYHPKPALAAVADGSVRHHDLTALLWAAGIARERWVES